MHLLARHVEHAIRELRLQLMHASAGEHQMVAGRVVLADRTARFRRTDHEAIVDQLQLDDMCRHAHRGLHGICIALLEAIRHIVGCLVPKLWRIGLHRGGAVNDRRQLSPVHHHCLGGVARGAAGFGHYERDRVADMARAFGGQRVARRRDHGRDARHGHGARQCAQAR